MAWLFELGFESFEENEDVLIGYIDATTFEENRESIDEQLKDQSWRFNEVENKNWNAEWESNFQPIIIEDALYVRASFHEQRPEIPLEILIDPKMSFGTGHHQTTYLCSKTILSLDLQGKEVMDMGSGTGILAILSKLKNASKVVAIDNDEWAYENCVENVKNNNCDTIEVLLGDAETLKGMGMFGVFIANINRNILLRDLPTYAPHVEPGGHLILSGFYTEDVSMLEETTATLGFELLSQDQRDNWCCLLFMKTNNE